jgi:hypothetical protein
MKKLYLLLLVVVYTNLLLAGNCNLGETIYLNSNLNAYYGIASMNSFVTRNGVYFDEADYYFENNIIYSSYQIKEPGVYKIVNEWTGYNIIGQYSTWNEYSISHDYTCNHNDRSFVGDVNGDGKDELVLINTSYSDGAIRVVNLLTGGTLKQYNHSGYSGWMDETDKMFLEDVNGDGKKDLVLVNTSYSSGAILAIDLNTGSNLVFHSHPGYGGMMDATDRMFMGDVNGDGNSDLILVNTDYSGTAIIVKNIMTAGNISWINHSTFSGWMDASDRMFLGDVNGDNKEDLVMVNTSYSSGAIRVLNLLNGTTIKSYSHPGYSGWMDATDRMFLGDVNADDKEDLVMVNTSYSSGAILVKDLNTGNNIKLLSHPGYSGWMDATDRLFLDDINGDKKEDLVMVNTSYNSGAIRVLNLTTGGGLAWINHGEFSLMMDCIDKMFIAKANTDVYKELVMINTVYSGPAIRSKDIMNNTTILSKSHTGFGGWLDGVDNNTNCSSDIGFKSANDLNLDATIVNDELTHESISFYPNPVNDVMNVFIHNDSDVFNKLNIYNSSGQLISTITDLQSIMQIDVSDLDKGLYVISIISSEKINNFKFIKE